MMLVQAREYFSDLERHELTFLSGEKAPFRPGAKST